MANRDLQEGRHTIKGREDTWWYEAPQGVEVVVEYWTQHGVGLETRVIVLPWKDLRAALARKDK